MNDLYIVNKGCNDFSFSPILTPFYTLLLVFVLVVASLNSLDFNRRYSWNISPKQKTMHAG